MNKLDILSNNLLSDYDIERRVSKIPSNTTFILKDLFTDAEWSALKNTASRSSYSKAFAAIISEKPSLKVEFAAPTKGSQGYRKI